LSWLFTLSFDTDHHGARGLEGGPVLGEGASAVQPEVSSL
jgi:hypothetical protein